MDRPLRVALVGAGNVAIRYHLPGWMATAGAELTRVVDPRLDAAREAAERFGVPEWLGTFEDVLADSEVDAVDLATPALLHAQQTIAALAAGKHVIVEKPMATRLEDAEAMVSAAGESDRTAMVGENWIFARATATARATLAAGTIGKPFLFDAHNETPFLLRDFDRPERTDRDRLGYGFVGGIHSIAIARHLMGEVEDIAAVANTTGAETGLGVPYDADMVIACRFRAGGIGSLLFTGRAHEPSDGGGRFRLLGTLGRISFDVFSGRVETLVEGHHEIEQDTIASTGHPEMYAHFLDCIAGRAEPLTSLSDQAENLRCLYRAYRTLS